MNEYETLSKLLLKNLGKLLLMKDETSTVVGCSNKALQKMDQKQEVFPTQEEMEKNEDKLCTQLLPLQNI